MSKIIKEMTGREVLESWAEIDQASRQRRPPGPVEVRRMELQAANKICALFGVGLE